MLFFGLQALSALVLLLLVLLLVVRLWCRMSPWHMMR